MQQFNFTCSLMPGTPGSTDIIDEVFLVTVSATQLSRLFEENRCDFQNCFDFNEAKPAKHISSHRIM